MSFLTALADQNPAPIYSAWTDAKDEPGIQYRVRNAHALRGGWYTGGISLERRMKPYPAQPVPTTATTTTQTTLSTDPL